MPLNDDDMTTAADGGTEGPADSGAGLGTPGEHDGGADSGAEGPALRSGRRHPRRAGRRRRRRSRGPGGLRRRWRHPRGLRRRCGRGRRQRCQLRHRHGPGRRFGRGPGGGRRAVPPRTVRRPPAPPWPASSRTDAATFGDRHWGRAPLLVRAADPQGFRDLLDLDGVDELLSRRGLRTPFLRLAKTAPSSTRRRSPASAGSARRSPTRCPPTTGAALFADGSTVVLQGLHRLWPPLIDFADQLAADLGHPTQANAYVTPPSRGASARTTTCTTSSCCSSPAEALAGSTPRCTADPLRDPALARPRRGSRRGRRAAPGDRRGAGPGDALYLPRG